MDLKKKLFLFFLLGVQFSLAQESALKTYLDDFFQERKKAPFFSGFFLYDLEGEKEVYSYQKDKLFTPASTQKIWPFFINWKIFERRLPLFQWAFENGKLWIRGVGSPFLAHSFLDSKKWIDSLQNLQPDSIFYIPQDRVDRWAPGWAWDDGLEIFQLDRASTPILGNIATLIEKEGQWDIRPPFELKEQDFPSQQGRLLNDNIFFISKGENFSDSLSLPFIWDDTLVARGLSYFLKQKIFIKKDASFVLWRYFFLEEEKALSIGST